jgi:ABC-type transporter Mla MlaB component
VDLDIDVHGVEFTDSNGVSALAGIARHAVALGRHVRVVGANAAVSSALRLSGLPVVAADTRTRYA